MAAADAALYPHVAEPCPRELRQAAIIDSLPAEVFQIEPLRAWAQVARTVALTAVGVWLLAISPAWLLPALWAFTGTALTGFFVIAHDCGHRSFSRSDLVNDIVGNLMLLPLFYPFEAWRIQHNLHHNNTNKLHVDNAWHPFMPNEYDTAPVWRRLIMRAVRSWEVPLYPIGSIGHWLQLHWDTELFRPSQRPRVALSVRLCYYGALLFFPAMILTVGVWGLVKLWLMPWLVFHFWLSTFTLVHHTLPHVPFEPEGKWHDAAARLSGTVHCDYGYAIEALCHHINVHVPHHVSTRIPAYKLRDAFAALRARWGAYVNEASFSLYLLHDILTRCQLYHPKLVYTSFERHELAAPPPADQDKPAPAKTASSPAAVPRRRSPNTGRA